MKKYRVAILEVLSEIISNLLLSFLHLYLPIVFSTISLSSHSSEFSSYPKEFDVIGKKTEELPEKEVQRKEFHSQEFIKSEEGEEESNKNGNGQKRQDCETGGGGGGGEEEEEEEEGEEEDCSDGVGPSNKAGSAQDREGRTEEGEKENQIAKVSESSSSSSWTKEKKNVSGSGVCGSEEEYCGGGGDVELCGGDVKRCGRDRRPGNRVEEESKICGGDVDVCEGDVAVCGGNVEVCGGDEEGCGGDDAEGSEADGCRGELRKEKKHGQQLLGEGERQDRDKSDSQNNSGTGRERGGGIGTELRRWPANGNLNISTSEQVRYLCFWGGPRRERLLKFRTFLSSFNS